MSHDIKMIVIISPNRFSNINQYIFSYISKVIIKHICYVLRILVDNIILNYLLYNIFDLTIFCVNDVIDDAPSLIFAALKTHNSVAQYAVQGADTQKHPKLAVILCHISAMVPYPEVTVPKRFSKCTNQNFPCVRSPSEACSIGSFVSRTTYRWSVFTLSIITKGRNCRTWTVCDCVCYKIKNCVNFVTTAGELDVGANVLNCCIEILVGSHDAILASSSSMQKQSLQPIS